MQAFVLVAFQSDDTPYVKDTKECYSTGAGRHWSPRQSEVATRCEQHRISPLEAPGPYKLGMVSP